MPYEFLPIDDNRISFTAVRGDVSPVLPQALVDKIRGKSISLPSTLKELTNQRTFQRLLSVQAAIALGLPVGSADASFSRQIFVQEFLQYKLFEEGNEKVLFGVGIRWTVDLRVLDVKANLGSVPMLAASAQMGYLQASVQFDVLGLSSDKIRTTIPAPTELNVEQYAKLAESLKAIKALMEDPSTITDPQILAIQVETREDAPDHYESCLAASWALTCISRGRTRAYAEGNYRAGSHHFQETVQAVYRDFARTTDLSQKPDSKAIQDATRMLNGLKVQS